MRHSDCEPRAVPPNRLNPAYYSQPLNYVDMHDSERPNRWQPNRRQQDCRVQLLVHRPLQMYLVARTVLLSTSVALTTALMYVGVDWYVADRLPTAMSFVPLLISIVVTTPLVLWFALVASQKVVAPFVRLAAWARQATHNGGPAEHESLRLRAGDPSAELATAIQRAIVELNTASTDGRFSVRQERAVPMAAAASTAARSIGAANLTPPRLN